MSPSAPPIKIAAAAIALASAFIVLILPRIGSSPARFDAPDPPFVYPRVAPAGTLRQRRQRAFP
jgi:hypothetical protein